MSHQQSLVLAVWDISAESQALHETAFRHPCTATPCVV